MKIGPLVQPPPLVPFMTGFGGALQAAGVMEGGHLLLPSRISNAGAIEYDAQSTSVYFDSLENRPFDDYRRLAAGRDSESAFISQCERVDGLTDMKTFKVSAALRRMQIHGLRISDELPDMLSRLNDAGERTLGEIANFVHSSDGAKGMTPLRWGLLERVADDIGYAASMSEIEHAMLAKYGPGTRYNNKEAAGFYYVAGIFHAMSGAADSMECAVGALLQSARIYSELKMDVAAALVAEAAVFYGNVSGVEDDRRNETLEKAAGYWLKVAETFASSDEAAALIAIQRGILPALIHEGDSIIRVQRRFNSLASGINEKRGMYARSGQDYLRMSFVDLINFEGSVRCWQRIADSIYKAIGAYERAGDGSMLRKLRPLEAMARRESRELKAELAKVESDLADDPDDPILRQRRAFVKMRHGDLKGAHKDLEQVDEASPGNAWFLSDVGLALHHLAHYHMFKGDHEQAQSDIAEALDNIKKALKIAEASETPSPIIYARTGALFMTLGFHEAALENLVEAHALDQGDDEVYDYLRVVRLKAPSVFYPLH